MQSFQVQYERCVKENDMLNTRFDNAKENYTRQMMENNRLSGENSQKNAELKLKEDEIGNLKSDIARINKLREGLNRRLRVMEDQKNDVESSRESLRQHVASLERGEFTCNTSFGYSNPVVGSCWARVFQL